MGTLVALALALHEPADVAGLVLLSGYYFPSVRADVALGSWPAVPALGAILRYTISPLLGRLTAPMVYRKLSHPRRLPSDLPANSARARGTPVADPRQRCGDRPDDPRSGGLAGHYPN